MEISKDKFKKTGIRGEEVGGKKADWKIDAREASKFTTYAELQEQGQSAITGYAGDTLEMYLNTLHKRLGDEHGGNWTYGTADRQGESTWEIRVWSQSGMLGEVGRVLGRMPNLLIKLAFMSNDVKVELVEGNRNSLFKKTWSATKASGSSIGMACGEAWEKMLRGSVDYGD